MAVTGPIVVGRWRRRVVAGLIGVLGVTGLAWVAAPIASAIPRAPVHVNARTVQTEIGPDRDHEDVRLPIAASHVEIHWRGDPNAVVTVAFAQEPGTFGASEVVTPDDAGTDSAIDAAPGAASRGPVEALLHDAGRAATGAAPDVWGQVMLAEGARFVRVASDRPLAQLTVEAIDSRGSAASALADATAALAPAAEASVGEPAIISRAAWGADETLRFDSGGHEREARNYFPLQKLVVHHTDGSNSDPDPAATIRAIYYFHAMIRDWGDIGYNFLIDAQGHVYEGRYSRSYASGEAITGEDLAGDPVRATHAGNFNAGTIGIALLGTFVSVQPTTAARNALIGMLAWESERHALNPLGSSTYVNPETGLSKFLPTIIGHRDVDATDCPGDAFYSTLPTLRQQVQSRIAAAEAAGVDTTAPTGTLSPMLTPTGGSTTTFGLAFKEAVTGMSASDLTVGGTSAGWTIQSVSGSGASYTITVASPAPTDGTIELTLAAGSVADLSGNAGPPANLEATAAFATDTTRPTVVLWTTPHASAVTVASIDVSVTFSEPVDGLPLSAIEIGGTSSAVTPWTTDLVVGSGASYAFTVAATNPANGTLTLSIPDGATTDPAGNPSIATQVSLIVDRTAPRTGAPAIAVRIGATLGSAVPVTLTWSASDSGGSGLASFDVERSINGGAYSVIASHLPSAALAVSLTAGRTYRFAVRARDKAGNVGSWVAGPSTSGLVRQDNSGYILYGSGWRTGSATSYSGGTVHDASLAGAHASYTVIGRGVALVATRSPSRGQVRIYVDGVYVTTIDTRSSSSIYRSIVWTRAWSSVGTHVIKLVVVGTAGRPRVDLDAFIALK
jgi:hypothetical protein